MKQKLDQFENDVNPYETAFESSDDERPSRIPNTQAKKDKSELNKLQDQIFSNWPSDPNFTAEDSNKCQTNSNENFDDEVIKP